MGPAMLDSLSQAHGWASSRVQGSAWAKGTGRWARVEIKGVFWVSSRWCLCRSDGRSCSQWYWVEGSQWPWAEMRQARAGGILKQGRCWIVEVRRRRWMRIVQSRGCVRRRLMCVSLFSLARPPPAFVSAREQRVSRAPHWRYNCVPGVPPAEPWRCSPTEIGCRGPPQIKAAMDSVARHNSKR